MRFIHTDSPQSGIQEMATKIAGFLRTGKPVLWLICGGSNIPCAVSALRMIREAFQTEPEVLAKLTIAQTDERYGPVGHKDSNWQQMLDTGFDGSGIGTIPILCNTSLAKTVANYEERLLPVLNAVRSASGLVLAQFGIGEDGHVAGMLPHSSALQSVNLIAGYEAEPFTRITITPPAFKHINAAYAFVFGSAKKQAAFDRLKNENVPLNEEPCQILKQLPDTAFLTDLN